MATMTIQEVKDLTKDDIVFDEFVWEMPQVAHSALSVTMAEFVEGSDLEALRTLAQAGIHVARSYDAACDFASGTGSACDIAVDEAWEAIQLVQSLL